MKTRIHLTVIPSLNNTNVAVKVLICIKGVVYENLEIYKVEKYSFFNFFSKYIIISFQFQLSLNVCAAATFSRVLLAIPITFCIVYSNFAAC